MPLYYIIIVIYFKGNIPRHFATTVRTNSSAAPTTLDSDHPIDIANPFQPEKQQCILCRMNIHPDYKNVRLLSQFQSPYTGRIYGRHITGLCKAKQLKVEAEIIKSQSAGYMPVYHKAMEYVNDPPLFDPERPIRPHKH